MSLASESGNILNPHKRKFWKCKRSQTAEAIKQNKQGWRQPNTRLEDVLRGSGHQTAYTGTEQTWGQMTEEKSQNPHIYNQLIDKQTEINPGRKDSL